jgi:hypothetical protein
MPSTSLLRGVVVAQVDTQGLVVQEVVQEVINVLMTLFLCR